MSKEVSDAMSQISFAYVHPLLPRSIERNIPMNTWFKRLLAALAVFAVLAGWYSSMMSRNPSSSTRMAASSQKPS